MAHDILGRTLDELPPQTRRLLGLLQSWVKSHSQAQGLKAHELRFSRKEVRAATGWGDTQLKIHLGRLSELEYLQLYRRGLAHEYSLNYDGDGRDQAHLMGLLDADLLDNKAARSGLEQERSAPGRALVGTRSEAGKTAPGQAQPELEADPVGLNGQAPIRLTHNAAAALSSAG
ncbi:hypothetical protein [Pseudomonas aeruginosa]|uniref:hypothetical protein n=1 Tax=Pseudomonas aeruginosa TaxID=287 RepID=UPI000EB5B6FB|nr:hypothetical protein [Pseudomonas aeruginosa]RUB20513.1 hypothetical protein IPC1432_31990 [Pseudomonas aeruginosa]